MFKDYDTSKICRDEDCEIEEVHRAHKRLRKRPIVVHRRSKIKDPSKRPLWQQDSPEALRASVLQAVGDRPMMMQWIQNAVRNDYGEVTDRTIYRWVKRLIAESQLIRLDLGLSFSAYIKPTSRFIGDRAELREYMLANSDSLPSCVNHG